MRRASSILVASLFAVGAAAPAFAWTHGTANVNHGAKLVAGAGVHKTAIASDEEGTDGSSQPDQPAQPPSTDDGD